MKERISITIEESVVKTINSLIKGGKYRNRSHFVEYAIQQLAKGEQRPKEEEK
jgi:Arc/MetJ-type ribon-helix-helix transcriptional regulator